MKASTAKEKEKMTEMADAAMKNYDQAIKTGLKFQEEASKCLSGRNITH